MAPIAVPAPQVAEDRAPAGLAVGTPQPLRRELEGLLGKERVLSRPLDLVAYASDASPYRLIPEVVVLPRDAAEVATVLGFARRTSRHITFRAAGTSLNGQAQGESIMLDARRHWAGVRIEEGGQLVRVRPGTVVGHVNRALAKYARRLGPDPASSDFATVGGVIANNSGGMRCGVHHDAYRTIRSLSFVLPSGTTIDSAAPGAAERFAREEPALARGLAEIREELLADEELCERIRRKFEIKNTTGYRLCAFLDASEPLEIFRRLLVGSEGTLAFVSEAVFETVPHGHHTATALLFFKDIDAAAAPVTDLVRAGASAVELMVNPTLIAASHMLPGIPERWRELPPEGAVLLVELRSEGEGDLDGPERAALAALENHELSEAPAFTREAEQTELYWRVREGMQGIVGLVRPPGSSLIIEDVCVPPGRIADSARDIQALLGKHGFLTGVAGHASAGNLHFLLTPNLTDPADRERYDGFMHELIELVVDRYGGSLKAEHGTGRNMAPYLQREWGPKATELMWRIKRLADPEGVLAPDVLLSEDPEVHLRHLKSTPPIEEDGKAHLCIECGFCEPVCPSRNLTTTPRQRIVVRREMARQPPGSALTRALAEQYRYDGIETCAVDGSCRLACPLGIDTGALTKELRGAAHGPRSERAALAAARRWGTVESAARGALRAGGALAGLLGDRALGRAADAARRLVGPERLPRWSAALPYPASPRLPDTEREGATAVYLPACINRIFGVSRPAGGRSGLAEALVEVSRRAGQPVWIPPDVAGHCCATPFSSKGYRDAHREMSRRVARSALRWTAGGRLPLLIDASSCALGLVDEVPAALEEAERESFGSIEVIDPIGWAERLLGGLEVREKLSDVAVHPNCSARHLGQAERLMRVAGALADEVRTPLSTTCCGFAGDRGMLHPELTASATAEEAAELPGLAAAYVSSNRTCELALEQAAEVPFESIVQLLERLT